MNPQIKKLLIILFVLVLIVGGFLGWWWWQNREQPVSSEPPVIIEQPDVNSAQDQQVQDTLSQQISGKSEEEIGDYASIVNTSRYFVERYGSFSDSAAWQNIDDIKSVVTNSIYSDLQSLRSSTKQVNESYALSTKTLAVNVENQTDNSAVVLVKTQKREVSGGNERIFYQDITLQLVKDNGVWLVADFNIGPEKK